MRVLLIEPPFQRFMGYRRFYFPISLCYLAGYLNAKGYYVRVYDSEFNENAKSMTRDEQIAAYDKYIEGLKNEDNDVWEELRNVIIKQNPDVVGISIISNKLQSAYMTARICKDANPRIKTVVGGPHPTALPEQVLMHEEIDFVVRGEGEATFHELLEALKGGIGFERVDGISFREKERIIHNKSREFIKDIDSLPYEFRKLIIGYERYAPRDMGMIIGSRGCPYNCYFCASKTMWQRRVRYRSLNNIIEEVKYLMKEFNTTHFIFEDDNFDIPKQRIIDFCKMLNGQGIKITWEIQARVNSIDKEICELLKESGCVDIAVGIETGSEKMLKHINKQASLDDARRAARAMNETGMPWKAFIVIGFPEEAKEDIYETIRFVEEIKPKFTSLHIFTPFPGTEFFSLYNIPEDEFCMYEPQSPHNCFSKHIDKKEFPLIVKDVIKRVNKLNEENRILFEKSNVWGVDR